jgi:hypothetical protein
MLQAGREDQMGAEMEEEPMLARQEALVFNLAAVELEDRIQILREAPAASGKLSFPGTIT